MVRSLLLALTALMVAACSADDPIFKARSGVDATNRTLTEAVRDADSRAVQRGRITESQGIALGGVRIPLRHGDPLPATLSQVSLDVGSGMTLGAGVQVLAAQAGYPVAVLGSGAGDIPLAPGRYAGPLEQALQDLASRHGFRWENTGTQVVLTGANTELIQVPVRRQLDMDNVPSCGNSVSTSSRASQRRGQDINVYEDIQKMAKALPYPDVTIETHPNVGVIAIRGPAGTARQVRTIVEDRVRLMNQQIVVTLRLIAVDVTNQRDFATRFDVAIGSLINGQPGVLGFDITNGGRAELLRALPAGIGGDTASGLLSSLSKVGTIVDNRRIDRIVRAGGVTEICDRSFQPYVEQIAPPQISSVTNVNLSQVPGITQKTLEIGMMGPIGAVPINQSQIALSYSLVNDSLVSIQREEAANGFRVQQPLTTKRLFNGDYDLASGDTVFAGSYVTEAYTDQGSGVFYGYMPLPGERQAIARKILVVVLASATLKRENPALIRKDPALRNPLSTVSAPVPVSGP